METSNHILWLCSAAKDVWADFDSFLPKAKCVEMDFIFTWEEWIDRLTGLELKLSACVFKKLWLRRNRWVLNDFFDGPKKLWQGAKVDLKEFQQAQASVKGLIAD